VLAALVAPLSFRIAWLQRKSSLHHCESVLIMARLNSQSLHYIHQHTATLHSQAKEPSFNFFAPCCSGAVAHQLSFGCGPWTTTKSLREDKMDFHQAAMLQANWTRIHTIECSKCIMPPAPGYLAWRSWSSCGSPVILSHSIAQSKLSLHRLSLQTCTNNR
jgi:hypothetical protein